MPDARQTAAHLIRAARRAAPASPVLAFGTPGRMVVACGERDSFRVGDGAWERRRLGEVLDCGPDGPGIWKRVDEFLTANDGEPVIGFLGFDLHRGSYDRLPPTRGPSTFLTVPESLARVDGHGTVTVERGPGPWMEGQRRLHDAGRDAESRRVVLSDEVLGAYHSAVERALAWIGGRDEARVTIAAQVPVDFAVDLPGSLAAPLPAGPASTLSRSFFAAVDGLELVGTSPELLAIGSTSCFRTYKLSGTFPVPDGTGGENGWRARLLDDERVQREHASSLATLMDRLATVGRARRGGPNVLPLEGLVHLMTPAVTWPRRGAMPLDCIASVFPSGVWPFPDGLSVVADVEPEGRGPYYGLFGTVEASGRFEWSQLLRAVVRAGSCCVPVGAAVTVRSTPDVETAEIRAKLRTVHLREQ